MIPEKYRDCSTWVFLINSGFVVQRGKKQFTDHSGYILVSAQEILAYYLFAILYSLYNSKHDKDRPHYD